MRARGAFFAPALVLAPAILALAAPFAAAQDGTAPAQVPASGVAFAAFCVSHACRTERHEIRLRAAGGASFGTFTDTFPYVDDEGSIVIYAGERFAVGFPDADDPSKPQFVRAVSDTDTPGAVSRGVPMLMIQLRQIEGQQGMQLTLFNATAAALKFDATMYVPMKDGVQAVPTSTCALMPGAGSTEYWQHPVVMVVLRNGRRADVAGGVISCN